MKRTWLVLALAIGAFAAPKSGQVTYYRDVLPVIQKNCQSCHRAGEAAPMAFSSFKDTRPWAKAIKEAVVTRRMPPWFADPHVGKFSNDRSLSQAEVQLLAKWADSGAAEGNLKDAPTPVKFVDGWNIGEPQYTVEMPVEFVVPASGTVDYTYFVIPTGFTEDRWVRLAEVRPGNRKVVHHVIAFIREPGSKWLSQAKPGVPYTPKKGSADGDVSGGEFLVGYAPGYPAEDFGVDTAKRVKAGSDIVLQMHYTADGKVQADRSRVGFVFQDGPPKERLYTLAAANSKFVIPPGDANYKVESSITLQKDSTLISMMPHMHLRGKAFEYRVIFPNGDMRELLRVPNYSFNWQLTYRPETPLHLPKGTRIECSAWFDNSANNKFNPDPKSEVRFGEQSWEEMMIGFFNVAFSPQLTPRDLVQPPKKATAASSGGAE